MIDLTVSSPNRIIDKFIIYSLDNSEIVPAGGTYFITKYGNSDLSQVDVSVVTMIPETAEHTHTLKLDTWYAYRCVECNKRPSWFPEAHAGLCIMCHAFATEVRQHNMRTPIIVDEDGTNHIEKLEKQIRWQQQLIDKLIAMAIPPF